MKETETDKLSPRIVFKQAGFAGKASLALSTWFGAGLLPFAPGTFGTIAGLPLVLLMADLGPVWRILILAAVITIGVKVSGKTRSMLKKDDPGEIVIDEVAGFLLTMTFLPCSVLTIGAAFILFRFFDILKPFPLRIMERLKGGIGIMADDLGAGIYAYICVRGLLFFFDMNVA